jgi:hypothetical protein
MLAGLFPVCHIFIAEYRARFLFDVFARSISIPPRARSLYSETDDSVTHWYSRTYTWVITTPRFT